MYHNTLYYLEMLLQVTVVDRFPDLKMLCIVEYILLTLLWCFYVVKSADSCCVHTVW
jgi:hypothetical protein